MKHEYTRHEHVCPRCNEQWGDTRCRWPGREWSELLCPACHDAEMILQSRGVNTRQLFDVQGAQGRWGGQKPGVT